MDNRCVICRETIDGATRAAVIECGHDNFHGHCVVPWATGTSSTCPLCRRQVTAIRVGSTIVPVEPRKQSANNNLDDDYTGLQDDGSEEELPVARQRRRKREEEDDEDYECLFDPASVPPREWEVEKIVDCRQDGCGGFEYKLVWATRKRDGQKPESWEPAANLTSCDDILCEYLNGLAKRLLNELRSP